jgi:Uma2 family endonuclease
MSTAMLPQPAQRLVLSGIDWPTYKAMSDLLAERNVRLTYDRGDLEFTTLSPEHGHAKKLLARLVEALTEELDIDVASFGSMTCRREDLARGFEPDECYWIAHEPQVRGRTAIDLDVDPPPDLALEIEITRNIIDRLPLCAALRVPEVWRFDGVQLRVLSLGPDGQYAVAERSAAFPFLPLQAFAGFLTATDARSETKLVRAFRAWVQAHAQEWRGTAGQ